MVRILSLTSACRCTLVMLVSVSVGIGLAIPVHAAPDQVEYEVTFDATWSAATHPGAYPGGAHWSPLVGTTHNGNVSFWEVGQLATTGIERMAETGATSTLRNEILAAGADSDTLLLGSGIASPGNTSIVFDVNKTHPLVTLVSMVAPSPDWFVGVSGLDLLDGNQWVEEVVIDLFSYDSGTDSGTNFTSPNADTNPADPISLITTGPLGGTPALGTFTFRRIPEPSGLLILLAGAAAAMRRNDRRRHRETRP